MALVAFVTATATSKTLSRSTSVCIITLLIMSDQDTRSCVMRPSLDARDTVCYLHESTLSCIQPFITQKLLGQF